MAKGRGRPPLDDDDPSVDVHLSLPSREYDELYARARRDRVSVPECSRQALREREEKPKT